MEENLIYLQGFYLNDIANSIKLLPSYKREAKIERYEPLLNLPFTPLALKIYNVSNPGWSVAFNYANTKYMNYDWCDVNINIEGDANEDWFFACKKDGVFKCASSPLYLSVILESFRGFIEGVPFEIDNLHDFRQRIKRKNPLLCWLEELYYHYCEWDDWSYGYGALGVDLMSINTGWVVIFSLEEVDLGDKPFKDIFVQGKDGTVELYKKGDKLVIETHPRGLIKGLQLFKDWVES